MSTLASVSAAMLITVSGVVLSRDRILEHVWDYAYDGVSNVIDQYVLYLRRKIDRPFGVRQLDTVRGAGYRLREHPTPSADRGRTCMPQLISDGQAPTRP